MSIFVVLKEPMIPPSTQMTSVHIEKIFTEGLFNIKKYTPPYRKLQKSLN